MNNLALKACSYGYKLACLRTRSFIRVGHYFINILHSTVAVSRYFYETPYLRIRASGFWARLSHHDSTLIHGFSVLSLYSEFLQVHYFISYIILLVLQTFLRFLLIFIGELFLKSL